MTDTTELTREEVEALLDGATPGPWRAEPCGYTDDEPDEYIICQRRERGTYYGVVAEVDAMRNHAAKNASLFAAAHTLARQLLAAMDDNARLQAALSEEEDTAAFDCAAYEKRIADHEAAEDRLQAELAEARATLAAEQEKTRALLEGLRDVFDGNATRQNTLAAVIEADGDDAQARCHMASQATWLHARNRITEALATMEPTDAAD